MTATTHALRAEWTKFRTVRGWWLGCLGAVLAALLLLLVGTAAANQHPQNSTLPTGPGGEAVNDNFYLVHRTLTGDGSLTVAVTGLSGLLDEGPGGTRSGVTPWAKAGIILRQSLDQGSRYALMTVTGAHGVRFQADFTRDAPGLGGSPSVAAPRWLRLVRSGAEVVGYDSADGLHWTERGRARIADATSPVEAGLFAASPSAVQTDRRGGGSLPAVATGTFARPALNGAWTPGTWRGTQVGGDAGTSGSYTDTTSGGFTATATGFTVTGAGDIAPVVGGPALGPGYSMESFLTGSFAALLVLAVVAVQFMTAEYRRGLLGVTFAGTPRRGRVLAAKALVVAAVGFAVGTVAAVLSLLLGQLRAHAAHFTVLVVPPAVQVRSVLGTGVLLAVVAVLALSVGVLLRRSATAISLVVLATVLPWLLAFTGMLPAGAAEWLLRVTPAAGFALQQTLPRYAQVLTVYQPANGYYPLSPWGGAAVLGGWTLLAAATAAALLRRRDV